MRDEVFIAGAEQALQRSSEQHFGIGISSPRDDPVHELAKTRSMATSITMPHRL
jgi:hypothetical protein